MSSKTERALKRAQEGVDHGWAQCDLCGANYKPETLKNYWAGSGKLKYKDKACCLWCANRRGKWMLILIWFMEELASKPCEKQNMDGCACNTCNARKIVAAKP